VGPGPPLSRTRFSNPKDHRFPRRKTYEDEFRKEATRCPLPKTLRTKLDTYLFLCHLCSQTFESIRQGSFKFPQEGKAKLWDVAPRSFIPILTNRMRVEPDRGQVSLHLYFQTYENIRQEGFFTEKAKSGNGAWRGLIPVPNMKFAIARPRDRTWFIRTWAHGPWVPDPNTRKHRNENTCKICICSKKGPTQNPTLQAECEGSCDARQGLACTCQQTFTSVSNNRQYQVPATGR